MESPNSTGFLVINFIILTIIAAVLIAFIFYFNEIRQGRKLTSSEITTLMVIGILVLIGVLILWISIIYLFFTNRRLVQHDHHDHHSIHHDHHGDHSIHHDHNDHHSIHHDHHDPVIGSHHDHIIHSENIYQPPSAYPHHM